MSSERRREDRLIVSGVSLWIKHKDGATICEVLNLSRLGVGLKIPEDALLEKIPSLDIETELDSTLRIGKISIPLGLKVLRIKGTHLGCSFIFPTAESQKLVFESLSPRFVAQSLTKVGAKVLNPHLKYAYFGNDFFVIAHAGGKKYQLSAAGYDAIINEDQVNLIDHHPDAEEDLDPEFSESYNSIPHPKMSEKDVVDWMLSILSVWESPPDDISQVVARLRAYHAV